MSAAERVINDLNVAKLILCNPQMITPEMCIRIGQAITSSISMLKKQEWVKCSDRLPEERDTIFAKLKGTDKWKSAMFEKMSEDVRVVVVFEDGTRRVHHSYTVDGEWDIEKKQPKRTVTHWMPNPKLPEEGR